MHALHGRTYRQSGIGPFGIATLRCWSCRLAGWWLVQCRDGSAGAVTVGVPFSAVARLAASQKAEFPGMMALVWIDFIGFRRDEKMGLFLALLWCSADVLGVIPGSANLIPDYARINSRFRRYGN